MSAVDQDEVDVVPSAEEKQGQEVTDFDENADGSKELEADEGTEEGKIGMSTNDEQRVDVAIVGGGPAGAYAALRIKRLHPGAHVVLFEAGGSVGGAQAQPHVSPRLRRDRSERVQHPWADDLHAASFSGRAVPHRLDQC